MCGIKTIFYCCTKCKLFYDFDDSFYFHKLVNRGPDSFKTICKDDFFMGIRRLSFINTTENLQPYSDEDMFFVCNGEIYNFKEIDITSKEDCKVIYDFLKDKKNRNFQAIHYFLKYKINGEYAFVFYDKVNNDIIIARDEYGVRPLYHGFRKCLYKKKLITHIFCSELKAINPEDLKEIMHFPPGTFYLNEQVFSFKNNMIVRPKRISLDYINKEYSLKQKLIECVKRRVLHFDETSNKSFGCLLSGGVDSSLVTAISFNILKEQFGLEYAQNNLYAFSIYYVHKNRENVFSEDIKKAIEIKEFLNLKHHYIVSFCIDDIIMTLKDVIKQIETYDITTIRASIPQYLLAQYIKKNFPFIKFIMCGEGADEIFGGYRYLKGIHNIKSLLINKEMTFENECDKLLNEIHYFDGLRTDRTMSGFSLEVRVPFLDKTLISFVKRFLTTKDKICTINSEKDILRRAFKGYIPDSILMRPKEAFSDSVNSVEEKNSNWFNILFTDVKQEKIYYKDVFNSFYKFNTFKKVIPNYWMPSSIFTDGIQVEDPSAKILLK